MSDYSKWRAWTRDEVRAHATDATIAVYGDDPALGTDASIWLFRDGTVAPATKDHDVDYLMADQDVPFPVWRDAVRHFERVLAGEVE